ncbi:MAG: DMT family transporter [Cocleimonas sp.]
MSSNKKSLSEASEKHQFRTGIFFAIVGTALFSLKSIFAKLAFQEGVDATTLVTIRMLIAFPFFLVILIYALKTHPEKSSLLTKRDISSIILLGFIGYYLASYLDFQGLFYISAQLERLTLFTYPIMVAVLSWIFFKEKITLRILMSLLISYIGVSFLFFNEKPSASLTEGQVLIGTSYVFVAAISFSFYVIFSKAYISRLGSLIFTSIAMSSSLVFVLVQFFASHELADLNVSARVWILIGLLAVFSTVIPSFLMSEAINRLGATKTSIMGSIGPVVTIILAVNLLDEQFGWAQTIGLLLVLLGVSLLRSR